MEYNSWMTFHDHFFDFNTKANALQTIILDADFLMKQPMQERSKSSIKTMGIHYTLHDTQSGFHDKQIV